MTYMNTDPFFYLWPMIVVVRKPFVRYHTWGVNSICWSYVWNNVGTLSRSRECYKRRCCECPLQYSKRVYELKQIRVLLKRVLPFSLSPGLQLYWEWVSEQRFLQHHSVSLHMRLCSPLHRQHLQWVLQEVYVSIPLRCQGLFLK